MNRTERPGLLARAIVAVSLCCYRRPTPCLVVCGALFALSLAVGQAGLQLRMDWTYLFYPDDEIVVSGQEHRELFPLPGDIAVLIDQGTEEQRRILIDRIAEQMAREPDLFFHVLHRLDLTALTSKALYYLEESQLEQALKALRSLNGADVGASSLRDGAGKTVLLRLLEDLELALETRGRATYVPIWESLTDGGTMTSDYLGPLLQGERYLYPTVGNGRIQVIAAKAGTHGEEFVNASPMIVRLREILEELRPTFGPLRVRLTGLPVLLHDERETVSSDGARSTVMSLLLVVMVFAVGFGEIKRPALAVLALCVGMGWTLGFTTLAVGHLNFISVTLTTMLVGVGIDFGIHFIFRYDEEMANGGSPERAIAITLEGTGVDTLVGAMATASAFLALTQAQFRGIADFGIIAAGGTLLCFLSTITVLPALLSLFPGQARREVKPSADVVWLEAQLLARARWVVLAWAVLIGLACLMATRVGFNYNLLEVQAQNVPTVRTELEMVRERNTVLSAEAVDQGMERARHQLGEFQKLPSVSAVGSILPLLPEISVRKQALVEDLVGAIETLALPEEVRLDTADDLLAVGRRVEQGTSALSASDPDIERVTAGLRATIATMDPGPVQDGLVGFQEHVREDLSVLLAFLQKQQAKAPTVEDLPPELRLRYISSDGSSFRQNVQPVKDVWQRENLEEFLREIKSVDPGVMGHPVIQEAILSAFRRTLERTPWFTLLGVLVVFSLYLRSVRGVALSLLPAALAVLMIFAVMGWLGVDFNVVNFVGLPISVGLGAVYGVHSLHRMRELDGENVLTTSTGPALLLSGVTDIVGFASLMIADHRGISSLGLVISIGVGVSFTASLILLPALRRVSREWHSALE